MLRLVRQHATYGNVTATLALFVALGGSAYAVAQFPANSVGSRQLKKNAVTTAKIKNSAVTGAKVRRNSLTGADIRESTLGQVPSAAAANTATTATNATNATNASRATTATNAGHATTATSATTASRANAMELVTYKSVDVPLPGSAVAAALTAPCNAGQHVLGGGVELALPASETVVDQFPAEDTGWTARVTNSSATASTVTVYAICTAVATTGT
jgi:hypothetical protein